MQEPRSEPTLAASPRPVRQYLASLVQITRWQLLAAVLVMTLTSLTEGLGVALLFPILQVAGFNLANQGHVGHYTGEVRSLLVQSGLRPSLWLPALLILFLLLMAVRSLFSRIQSVLTFRTALTYELALSRRLYQAIISADCAAARLTLPTRSPPSWPASPPAPISSSAPSPTPSWRWSISRSPSSSPPA